MSSSKKVQKLAEAYADRHITSAGVSKNATARAELVGAYYPVAEMELSLRRYGKRMNRALKLNGQRIDALKTAWETPSVATIPEDLESRIDSMVTRNMDHVNGYQPGHFTGPNGV